MSLDAGVRTPDHLHMSRDETGSSFATTSGRSAMVAESGDTDAQPVTRPCAYTDVRLSHGGGTLAASAAPAVREPMASSSSASEDPSAPSAFRVGHLVTPSWRRSAADTERSMVAMDTAPTPDEGWEARTETWLTNRIPGNYIPGPLRITDMSPPDVGAMPGGRWTPTLPKAKAKAKAASAKAATRPDRTSETTQSWQGWQGSSWWDDTSTWRSGQRRGRGPYGKGDKGKK